MVQLAIRCHPCAPVPVNELGVWLERHVEELRAAAPHSTLRLSRLSQDGPSTDLEVGWLLELELPEGEPLLGEARLADSLRDMRLLGLQPTLLAPPGWPESSPPRYSVRTREFEAQTQYAPD